MYTIVDRSSTDDPKGFFALHWAVGAVFFVIVMLLKLFLDDLVPIWASHIFYGTEVVKVNDKDKPYWPARGSVLDWLYVRTTRLVIFFLVSGVLVVLAILAYIVLLPFALIYHICVYGFCSW